MLLFFVFFICSLSFPLGWAVLLAAQAADRCCNGVGVQFGCRRLLLLVSVSQFVCRRFVGGGSGACVGVGVGVGGFVLASAVWCRRRLLLGFRFA